MIIREVSGDEASHGAISHGGAFRDEVFHGEVFDGVSHDGVFGEVAHEASHDSHRHLIDEKDSQY